jgi:hypothetical protein
MSPPPVARIGPSEAPVVGNAVAGVVVDVAVPAPVVVVVVVVVVADTVAVAVADPVGLGVVVAAVVVGVVHNKVGASAVAPVVARSARLAPANPRMAWAVARVAVAGSNPVAS